MKYKTTTLGWYRLLPSLLLSVGLLLACLWWLRPFTAVSANLDEEGAFIGTDNLRSYSMAWGDWDGDGDLDLAVGNWGGVNQLFENESGELDETPLWESTGDTKNSYAVAWGDWDGDGDLDLAVGNDNDVNQVYENAQGTLILSPTNGFGWESSDSLRTYSIAWGDWDSDGDLDLAVGNREQVNQVFENEGTTGLASTAAWSSSDSLNTRSVAWGDFDNDGDLDLAVANRNQVNQVFENDGDSLDSSPIWESTGDTADTRSVAWGDWNGDEYLDLAFGNYGTTSTNANSVYENNQDSTLSLVWSETLSNATFTYAVAWGDWNSDGKLDLGVANGSEFNLVYQNLGNGLGLTPTIDIGWQEENAARDTRSLAWGDADGDGDLDLAFGNRLDVNELYNNSRDNFHPVDAWQSPVVSDTRSIAWGDWDGDGDLDLAVGLRNEGNRVYENVNGQLMFNPGSGMGWVSANKLDTRSVAWGDWDGDNDLDLAIGNYGGVNEVYLNTGGTLNTMPAWQTLATYQTSEVAWGDWDADGDLDLAVANLDTFNEVYVNGGSMLAATPLWQSADNSQTSSVAWGDWDADGDLDLAAANRLQMNVVYDNFGTVLSVSPAWQSTGDLKDSRDLAWGDYDGDGDLDLAVANFGLNIVYQNISGTFATMPGWQSTGDQSASTSVAWGDWDGDGDLDLAIGNWFDEDQIFKNEEGELRLTPVWESDSEAQTRDVAWADHDGDGDLDLAWGSSDTIDRLLSNIRHGDAGHPNSHALIRVQHPGSTAATAFYGASDVITATQIPIMYSLFDAERDVIGRIDVSYSMDGGDNWQTAVPAAGTIVTKLATAPYPTVNVTNTHVFTWDVLASGLFGQSDQVVLRFEAKHQATGQLSQTYKYTTHVPNSYRRPAVTAVTFPFRVRGSQVQVYTGTIATSNQLPNALVYRLPSGQANGAALMPSAERPLRTNQYGLLRGRGELNVGDKLMALVPVNNPITFTDKISLYHTSAQPTATGLNMHTVSQPGTQRLAVQGNNPFMLLNLTMSLEWDARTDIDYLEQLNSDVQRASEILFDLTNGQAALGDVTIYQAKENWLNSDVLVYATNNLRPNANLGGIVNRPLDDVISSTQTISNAFLPGQIRMGATWNRYGNPGGTIGEDWPRALAHEVGHYAFFLLDNYLGVSESGLLVEVDCPGSAMTDAYRQDYSEFLERSSGSDLWSGACLNTLAEVATGRSDWETMLTFFPFLNSNFATTVEGPSLLPLVVTKVSFVPVVSYDEEETEILEAPFFYLTDAANGSTLAVSQGEAQGYLFRTQGTADLTDDVIVDVGVPVGPLLQARGTAFGDRLCVFNNENDPPRLGCISSIDDLSTTVPLAQVPGWQPQIVVNPVNSRTLAVTVTQNVPTGTVWVQILPAAGPITTGYNITSPAKMMVEAGGDSYAQTFTFPYLVYNGFARVWVEGVTPHQESVAQFSLTPGWNGNAFGGWGGNAFGGWGGNAFGGWGGNAFGGWGANRAGWSAPVSSVDGQVMLFNIDNILAGNAAATLQALSVPPTLPSWLTPVGQVYRYRPAAATSSNLVIQFQYMQRELPTIQEAQLRIYYSSDEGVTWQRLENTELDDFRNLASARMQGGGLYGLMATIDTPALSQGWNLFAYPDVETRPITQALASINGQYSSVYSWDAAATPEWRLYNPTVLPAFGGFVNDLQSMERLRSYFVYALTNTVPYIGPPTNGTANAASSSFQFPPTTYYGWVTPTAGFTPTVGMAVTAYVDDTNCGQTTIAALDGKLAYKLQVTAENAFGTPNNCGQSGLDVTFHVGSWIMAHDQLWDNEAVWYVPLTAVQAPPAATNLTVTDGGTTANLTWQAVTATESGGSTTIDHYEVWRSQTPYFMPGDGDATKLQDVGGTMYTDNGIIVGQSYYYLVVAVDKYGQSSNISNRQAVFGFELDASGG